MLQRRALHVHNRGSSPEPLPDCLLQSHVDHLEEAEQDPAAHFRRWPRLALPQCTGHGEAEVGHRGCRLVPQRRHLGPCRVDVLVACAADLRADVQEVRGRNDRGRLGAVAAELQLFIEWEFLPQLDSEDGWLIDLYKLESSPRPIPQFNPGRVWAEHLGLVGLQIWPPNVGGGFEDQQEEPAEQGEGPEAVLGQVFEALADADDADGAAGGELDGIDAEVSALEVFAAEMPDDADDFGFEDTDNA